MDSRATAAKVFDALKAAGLVDCPRRRGVGIISKVLDAELHDEWLARYADGERCGAVVGSNIAPG